VCLVEASTRCAIPRDLRGIDIQLSPSSVLSAFLALETIKHRIASGSIRSIADQRFLT